MVSNKMSEGQKEKPFTIGIMTGSFHTSYSRMIIDAICEQMKGERIQIYIFPGIDAARFLNFNAYVDDNFDLHYYSTFEYSKFVALDLLIISFGTISAIPSPLPLLEFMDRLPKVPVIVLEDDKEVDNGIFITVDNYAGMKQCVEHLITEHGCKNITYVSGPENVPDSRLRMQAYMDAMKKHGLPVKEKSIVYGDFTDQVDPIIRDLLKNEPNAQAIVCANDEMAESAYRVIRENGLTPGKDILVTGFDDNDSACFMNPPLTTVRQDFAEVARTAAKKVQQVLHGEAVCSERIPANLIIRNSCGCQSALEDPSQEEERSGMVLEERSKVKKLQNENMISSLLLRGILTLEMDVRDFFARIGHMLNWIGTKRSCIALVEDPVFVEREQRMILPEQLRLYMMQYRDQVSGYTRQDAPVVTLAMLQAHMGDPVSHKQMAAFPLFSGEYHYGVLFAELSRDSLLFYYTLSLEIGTGIRYLRMSIEKKAAHRALEEKNQILDYSASHDPLTGLYNRSGAMTHAFSLLRRFEGETHFIAVMADLDHLKQINDSFGHDAGDDAIKKAAEILTEALSEDAVLGRTGGDEFSGFLRGSKKDPSMDLADKVKALCEKYNEVSQKPYYLGISVGCYEFDITEESNPVDVLKKADVLLYKAKKSRRESVIRRTVNLQ